MCVCVWWSLCDGKSEVLYVVLKSKYEYVVCCVYIKLLVIL